MMPWDDTQGGGLDTVGVSTGARRTGGYVLHEEGVPDVRFGSWMAARAAGEQRAMAAGLVVEGWRQEAPTLWGLLPDRRYTVEMR